MPPPWILFWRPRWFLRRGSANRSTPIIAIPIPITRPLWPSYAFRGGDLFWMLRTPLETIKERSDHLSSNLECPLVHQPRSHLPYLESEYGSHSAGLWVGHEDGHGYGCHDLFSDFSHSPIQLFEVKLPRSNHNSLWSPRGCLWLSHLRVPQSCDDPSTFTRIVGTPTIHLSPFRGPARPGPGLQ